MVGAIPAQQQKRKKYVMRRVTKANKITAEKKEEVISDFHKELNDKDKFTDFFLRIVERR